MYGPQYDRANRSKTTIKLFTVIKAPTSLKLIGIDYAFST